MLLYCCLGDETRLLGILARLELHVERLASLGSLPLLCLHSFAGVFYSLFGTENFVIVTTISSVKISRAKPLNLIGHVIEPVIPHEQRLHVLLDISPVVFIAFLLQVFNALIVHIATGTKPLILNHRPLGRVGVYPNPP